MQHNIAIIVAGYNRPQALQRLLRSINNADFHNYSAVPLIISIDHSGKEACHDIAKAFDWPYGEKIIIQHTANLGLKKHIIGCGDMVADYDAIILLEDDLLVASGFYDYAQQAYHFYKDDRQVAGIGLYHYPFNESALCPFEPIADGYDNYFMQVPCSWGQVWTKDQWAGFKTYLQQDVTFADTDALPASVLAWPSHSSWKKFKYKYIVSTNKYYVYPRVSLTTNFGDVGNHMHDPQLVFQANLLHGNKTFHFSTISTSLSIYDAFFELEGRVYNKICNNDISLSFDLNGLKPLHTIQTTYLISNKKCKGPSKKYSLSLYPYENNIVFNIEADPSEEFCFSFAAKDQFSEEPAFNRLDTDVKRIFVNSDYLIEAGRKAVKKSIPYKIGYAILAPYYYFKRKTAKLF